MPIEQCAGREICETEETLRDPRDFARAHLVRLKPDTTGTTKGEEVIITRRDKPVARIVPEGAPRLADGRMAVAGLRDLQHRISVHTRDRARLSARDVRTAIKEGRL